MFCRSLSLALDKCLIDFIINLSLKSDQTKLVEAASRPTSASFIWSPAALGGISGSVTFSCNWTALCPLVDVHLQPGRVRWFNGRLTTNDESLQSHFPPPKKPPLSTTDTFEDISHFKTQFPSEPWCGDQSDSVSSTQISRTKQPTRNSSRQSLNSTVCSLCTKLKPSLTHSALFDSPPTQSQPSRQTAAELKER